MTQEAQPPRAALDRAENLIRYRIRLKKARTDLLELAMLFMPDPGEWRRGNYLGTRYVPGLFHKYLARKLGAYLKPPTKKTKFKHLALSVPAQHGKSQLGSIFFICAFIGNNPHLNVLFATYNENYARSIGRKVKAVLESDIFAKVFPGFALKSDSKSAEVIGTMAGGTVSFLGRGGSGTGKPADLIVIDDPIKGQAEAKSAATLADLREWYFSVMDTRAHSLTVQVIIHTRWVVDDLIGFLCDPTHPDYDLELAKDWDYINIPAVNTCPVIAAEIGQTLEPQTDPMVIEQFGNKPMAALWDERFPLPFLAKRKRRAPRVFESLMQGNPTPDDGDTFSRIMLRYYDSPEQLPTNLVYYGSSDHALTETRTNDPVCVGVIGVDHRDNAYIMPDLFWEHAAPDRLVEAIIAKLLAHRPIAWFAEGDMIGKALGPSIRREMEANRVYSTMHSIPITNDKVTKSANFQARFSLGKVYLPRFAPWCQAAVNQLMKFPNDRHDDFVDFCGIFFRGLDLVYGASRPQAEKKPGGIVPGTFDWLVASAKARADKNSYRRLCSIRD